MSQTKRYEDFIAHFSEVIPEELVDFAENDALLHSKYLFTRRVRSFQYGFCTSCKKEYLLEETHKHGQTTACRYCKYLLEVKASGRGRSKMQDEALLTWYSKSAANPNAITVTAYCVIRDYSGDYQKVYTHFHPVARYLFEPGRAIMMKRDTYFTGIFYSRRLHYGDGWGFAKKPYSVLAQACRNRQAKQSIRSIHTAVSDTPFRFSTWEQYLNNEDMVDFFALYAKSPCVEYLTKAGMKTLVEERLEGRQSWRSVHWQGKTMQKVLGLSKPELRMLKDFLQSGNSRKKQNKLTHLTLATFKWFRKNGVPISFDQANRYGTLVTSEYYSKPLEDIMKRTTLERIVQYMESQMKKTPNRYSGGTSFIQTWTDYIKDCKDLGIDLEQDRFLFPNNLHAAHQETIRKVKIKVDMAVNEQILARQKNLQIFHFSANGLFIRPATSSIELFDEGKALEHCVGGYSKKYASGEINLFLIRRDTDPDKPFYTMEVSAKDNSILQCRGHKNCRTTTEVDEFIQKFKEARLLKKLNLNTKPTKRQEVAV